MNHLKLNYEYWKQLEVKGLTGIPPEDSYNNLDEQLRVQDDRIDEKDETVQDFL